MQKRLSRVVPALHVALVLLIGACEEARPAAVDTLPGHDAGAPTGPPVVEDEEREDLLMALSRGEPRVVLVVEAEGTPTGIPVPGLTARGTTDTAARRALRRVIDDPRDWLFEGRMLPIVAVRLHSRAELDALEALVEVARVEPERAHRASAAPSLELIGQPAALARGADGRDLAVAVLDTGADFTHADLGACSAAGPTCPVLVARDFAPEDGVRDDGNRHGTNVAAIVRMVAPRVSILGLDVFTGSSAWSTHIVAAVDWLIANRDTYHIVAANLSLGYGSFDAPCSGDALAIALARLREAEIVPVVASGNNYYTTSIASPACAPTALSVGATDSSGNVAPFSNSASFLSVLGPGVGISAGGVTMSGTSQATPHVAGAVAAVRSAYPGDDAAATIARIVGTGVPTLDVRNGVTRPRLSVDAATAGGEPAPPPDIAAPTGTLTLPAFVRTVAVSYSIVASDASPITAMCISQTTSCTTFVPYVASGSFSVSSGAGGKTLRVWLRDSAGNVTAMPLTATTTLDGTPPLAGTLTARPGIGSVSLTLTGATDAHSGVASHRVVVSTGSAAPATCSAGTVVAESPSATYSFAGLVAGTTYRYRVCAVDRAGNVSAGASASAMVVAELDPPVGTIVLEGGASWARARSVMASLGASDASPVTQVCLATTNATCSSFVPFASTITATLASGAGERVIYAWFRDRWGNTSPAPVSDTIRLDASAPPNPPSISVTRLGGALALSWPSVVDAPGGSGLAGYVVNVAEGARAPACAGGASVSTAAHTATGLVDGRTYSFRVCAADVAGNVSSGNTGSAVPAPETAPPTGGSVAIEGGAAWTTSAAVRLTLAASDPSGVASMCISTTSTCTSWVAYAPTSSASLSSGSGVRTVNVWFRDRHGNTTSAPATDTILIDTAAPPNPRVTAIAESGAVELTWTESRDATGGSGVSHYLVAFGTTSTSPTCSAAATVPATSLRVARFTAPRGTAVRYRVCAVDVLGNASAGSSGARTAL